MKKLEGQMGIVDKVFISMGKRVYLHPFFFFVLLLMYFFAVFIVFMWVLSELVYPYPFIYFEPLFFLSLS